jgi:hypothetical protein
MQNVLQHWSASFPEFFMKLPILTLGDLLKVFIMRYRLRYLLPNVIPKGTSAERSRIYRPSSKGCAGEGASKQLGGANAKISDRS